MGELTLPGYGHLWLPSMGDVPRHIRESARAVTEYDSDLVLGRLSDEQGGDWVACMPAGKHGDYPLPVFNFGAELPQPEEVKRRLYMADIRRRGHKIQQDIQRRNEARLQALKDQAHDGSGQAAEAIEWAFRRMGKHPNPRIFVP